MQLFGQGKTPAEKMKEYNRNIKRSIREMDRERTQLERQEKKLMTDIKKEAKEGRVDSAKIMAKDLVRTRNYIKKMYKMKSHMEAVSLRLQTMQSSAQMVRRSCPAHVAFGRKKNMVVVFKKQWVSWGCWACDARAAGSFLVDEQLYTSLLAQHTERCAVRSPRVTGAMHEGRDQGDGHDEQEDEPAANTEDHDGVREAERDDGCAPPRVPLPPAPPLAPPFSLASLEPCLSGTCPRAAAQLCALSCCHRAAAARVA